MTERVGIIMAGGKGDRLMPLTEHKPKCLVDINGRPLIDYALDQMKAGGIEDVAIICSDKYLETVADSTRRYGMFIRYFREVEPKGEGAALRLARDFMRNSNECIVGMVDCIVKGPIVESLITARKNHGTTHPVFATAPWTMPHSIVSETAELRSKPTLAVLIGWFSYCGFPDYLNTADWVHQEKPYWGAYRLAHTQYEWYDAGSHEGLSDANKRLGAK